MDQFEAPFGEQIELRQILHESGVPLLRLIVRSGHKYYTIDLDPATAHRWGTVLRDWATQAASED
jgi:hypothetical protein